ncbi:leucine-rich repeat neuronal protein 4-like [Heterodontus francisci]|uniref:leucine-rich repeat neuronal protein 4-like n=1 Tax=Heterodontus francisci TaxID=7792 RepID=UPI00355AFBB7
MEAKALFFLLMEVVLFLPRTNGLPVDQPDHFPFYHMKTCSQNDTQLRLSRKNISIVPINTFQNFSALEVLDLSHNNLTNNRLPCGSLIIATLRHLDTASNQLTTVPSCLPTALESLDLSKNIIRQIEFSKFTDLHNLKILLLSHNKISEIVSSGTVLPQLASLDLSYNKFTKLQWKFQMPNLTVLRLEGNPLQQLSPYEFSHFPKLHYLNLSTTSLEACNYKAFASEMENLKILDLSANLFKTFDPQWFEGLNNLQSLWMRQMPFLQSLPADLFVHTPSLIHVDLEESPQLHFVTSSMLEFLRHLEFLSLKSCNLTEFRPWNFFNSTVTISLSGNPLVCSCELTWLITEPEKVLLNRANDTSCHKNGSQRAILLTDLIDECDISGNQTQELQVDANAVQTRLLEHTTAEFHNSSGITNNISSSKLPVESSIEFQFSFSTSSPKGTNLLNTLSFHGLSSDSNSGTLQTEEITTQIDQSWIKSKSRVKTSTWSTTARDQTGTKHYATTTKHYSTITRDQTVTKHYPTTTRDQTGTKHYSTITRDQTVTKHYPTTTRDQTGTKHYATTTRDQTVTKHYPTTTRDQTETKYYATTAEHYPTNTRDQTGTKHYPTTTRDQTGTKHYATTTRAQTGTKYYPTTTRDQTVTKHYPTAAKHSPTAAKHSPTATRDQTGTKHYPTIVTLETSTLPELPSTSTIIKKKGPIFIVIEDDDLESLEEEEITRTTHVGDCNYDPCRHWQVPCHDLQHLTGCRCPYITGEDVIPDPVKIQKVIKISDNSAEIYWCAPSSTVLHYYIIYQSDDNRHLYKTDTINPTYRRYTLRDLTSDSTYHTCVVAVNKAGSSTASSIWPSKGPCYIFKTKPNYNNIFYIASTAIIAILFILVIMLSVCLCRIRQKGRLTDLSRISLDPLTLQNPAFDNHLELADPRATIGTVIADSEQIP